MHARKREEATTLFSANAYLAVLDSDTDSMRHGQAEVEMGKR